MLKPFLYRDLSPQARRDLLRRPGGELAELFEGVRFILKRVQAEKDQAVRDFTFQYDGVKIENFEVPPEEWAAAVENLAGSPLASALERASESIRRFHQQQTPRSFHLETIPGVECSRRFTPVEKVGLYVPGGQAPLVSTVLMLGIPAAIAECQLRILCTPPAEDGRVPPAILLAARLVGIHKVYKVGGAQAIAAMALGTETIPKVDKIFGPGNRFVTAAKALVSLPPYATGIDGLAGPSELMIIADSFSRPAWIAADLISQAEHGPDSQVVLLSTDAEMIFRVQQELELQLRLWPENVNLRTSLENSFSLQVDDLDQAIEFANDYAPEHLTLACRDAESLCDKVRHAGSVFVGDRSSVVFGDYASGTNHTLPTGGAARFSGGLTLESFLKPISFQSVNSLGVQSLAESLHELTLAEGLWGHQRAAALRGEAL